MSWLRSLFALLLTLGLLVGAALFSLLLLPVLLVVFALAFGAFWWHTRHVRAALHEQLRAQHQWQQETSTQADNSGTVFDGEATVVRESVRQLPPDGR